MHKNPASLGLSFLLLATSTLLSAAETQAGRRCLEEVIFGAQESGPSFVRAYALDYTPPVSLRQNRRFIASVRDPKAVDLVYEMENPILKEMNDTLFENQDLADAATNLYKDIFFRILNDPAREEFELLRRHEVARYSDGKTVRLALKSSSAGNRAALENALGVLYSETARKYAVEIRSHLPEEIFSKGRGISANPAAWQLAGVGRTVAEAGVSARSVRSQRAIAQGELPTLRRFEDAVPYLDQQLRRAEQARQTLQRRLPASSGIMAPSRVPGQMILSADAVEILRKVKVQDRSWNGYVQAVRERLRNRFGYTVSEREVRLIQRYFSLTDGFSRGLLDDGVERLARLQAEHGELLVDFRGLGRRNFEATANGILPPKGGVETSSPAERVGTALRRVGEFTSEVDEEFDALKERYRRALNRSIEDSRAAFRGDDGMVPLTRQVSEAERLRYVDALHQEGLSQELRGGYVPQHYLRGGKIPDEARETFRSLATGVEKELRLILEGQGLAARFKTALIQVEFFPESAGGGGEFTFVFSDSNSMSSAEFLKMRQILDELVGKRNQAAGRPLYRLRGLQQRLPRAAPERF